MSAAVWAGGHVGRAWDGHELEDECPCPKAQCGLVIVDGIRDDCPHHAWSRARSMRQSHPAHSCPGAAGGEVS